MFLGSPVGYWDRDEHAMLETRMFFIEESYHEKDHARSAK